MSPVGRAVLGIVLVAGAGPAGFLIYHMVFNTNHTLSPRTIDGAPVIGSAPASAPASAPLSAPASAPAGSPDAPTQTTGTRAPVTVPGFVALPDSSGKMHTLAEYRGRPLVLNFWATWCEPCQREIPLLEALHQERGSGVQIVGVAMDFAKDVLPYAQARGMNYPLLMGEKDGLAAVKAFGMDVVLPFTVFADAKGDIIGVKVGELHADEARLILGKVASVDTGKMALADARLAVSLGLRSLAIGRAQQPSGPATGASGKS